MAPRGSAKTPAAKPDAPAKAAPRKRVTKASVPVAATTRMMLNDINDRGEKLSADIAALLHRLR